MSALRSVDLLNLPAARTPLYRELQTQLRTFLAEAPGVAMLPPERTLAKAYGVSRITVRKALQGLRDEGLISSRRGLGTLIEVKAEAN